VTREDYLNRGDIRREEIRVTGNPTRKLSAIITLGMSKDEVRRCYEDLGTRMARGGGYPQRRKLICCQCGQPVAGTFVAHAVRGCDYSLVNSEAERVALRAMAVAREAAQNAPNNREHIAALHADAVHGHEESHRQLGELRGQIGALASRLEARESLPPRHSSHSEGLQEEAAATEGREKKSADAEEAAASVAPPRQGGGVCVGDMPQCVICMEACHLNTATCTNCSERMCDECLVSRSADQVVAEGECSTERPVRLRCGHCRDMAVEIPENGTVTARDYMMEVAMAIGHQDARSQQGGTGVGSSRPAVLSDEEYALDMAKRIEDGLVPTCPKCGTGVERVAGCDAMQCSKCQVHFCWVCGWHPEPGEYASLGVHEHVRTEHATTTRNSYIVQVREPNLAHQPWATSVTVTIRDAK
jgi:hypothetical protein